MAGRESTHNIPGGEARLKEDLLIRLEQFIGRLERMQLAEYLRFVGDGKRFFWVNFWAGVARGLGTAVGFTLLGAVLIVILQQVVAQNIPLIGDFLARVIQVVQERM